MKHVDNRTTTDIQCRSSLAKLADRPHSECEGFCFVCHLPVLLLYKPSTGKLPWPNIKRWPTKVLSQFWQSCYARFTLAHNLNELNTPGLGVLVWLGLVSVVCLLPPDAAGSTFGARSHHSLWWLCGHLHSQPHTHESFWEEADQIHHLTTADHHHADHPWHEVVSPHQCNQEAACSGYASPAHQVPADGTDASVHWKTEITWHIL